MLGSENAKNLTIFEFNLASSEEVFVHYCGKEQRYQFGIQLDLSIFRSWVRILKHLSKTYGLVTVPKNILF